MPSAYTLLPLNENDSEGNFRKPGTLDLFPRIAWGSRKTRYILAVLIGVLFQLCFLLVRPPMLWRAGCLDQVQTRDADDGWTLETAREMVSHTKGFYARDYSLNLGWNNVRYIIEASVYQAKLLDRTLVLPSFVYARSCKYDFEVCAAFLPVIHWTEAAHRSDWTDHPFQEEYLFRVPLETVLDLQRLRAGPIQDEWKDGNSSVIKWPVITTAEYLQLHGLGPQIEQHNGYWGRVDYQLPPGTNVTAYHEAHAAEEKSKLEAPNGGAEKGDKMMPRTPRTASGLRRAIDAVAHTRQNSTESGGSMIYEMFNEEWDTAPLVRVDDVRTLRGYDAGSWEWANRSLVLSETGAQDTEMSRKLFRALNETLVESKQVVLGVGQVRQLAQIIGYEALGSDDVLERIINNAGWDFLHTFEGRLNEEFIKAIVWPMTQAAPRAHIRGFVNDLAQRTEDVVLVSGELHVGRKAGFMRFTSSAARDAYSQIGLYAMRAPERYWQVAARVESHMRARCGGRMFMAAHIRRGDFIRFGWTPSENLETHVRQVRDKLKNGAQVLADIKNEYSQKADLEQVDTQISQFDPPEDSDPFYIATDERSSFGINLIHRLGGVLIDDLLTPEDRSACGWEMLYSDLVGLVEQIVMSRASYWNAHAMSSLAGGVVNLRAARGADPRTALLD